MIPSKRRLFKNILKLFDLFVFVLSFLFAGVLAYSSLRAITVTRLLEVRITLGHCLLFVLLALVWHNIFRLCGLYISKRLTNRRVEIIEVTKATVLACSLLFLSAKIFRVAMLDAAFLVILWFFSTLLMISGRLVARSFLNSLRRRSKNSRYVLIVGTNERAVGFADDVTERTELGYHIVGFVDDEWHGTAKFEARGYKRCCSFAELADFLRHNVVDEAAIFLPLRSYYAHVAQLVSVCEQHGIVIRFNLEVFNLRNVGNREQDVDQKSHVFTMTGSTEAWPSFLKRLFDVIVSGFLLAVLSPVFATVALLIKFMSPGPVLFSQTRVGLNKRQFKMYKFRTMVADAEQLQDELLSMNEMSGPSFKIKRDPRITPIGKILRKTSIDELPQLFNVFVGEMSLVGPRAMSLRDYRLFDKDWQRRRFSVKPGITCLWQIKGRNSIPFEQWMEMDMQYIDKWSLWLDFKILVQTVPAVMKGTGAA